MVNSQDVFRTCNAQFYIYLCTTQLAAQDPANWICGSFGDTWLTPNNSIWLMRLGSKAHRLFLWSLLGFVLWPTSCRIPSASPLWDPKLRLDLPQPGKLGWGGYLFIHFWDLVGRRNQNAIDSKPWPMQNVKAAKKNTNSHSNSSTFSIKKPLAQTITNVQILCLTGYAGRLCEE